MMASSDSRSVYATIGLVIVGVLALAALGTAGGVIVAKLTRGVRNKNPGNLRLTAIAWKGKVPNAQNTDKSFEQFQDAEGVPGHIWGLRALYKDIYGDVFRDGQNTITKLISTYAPPSENDTQSYINAVSRAMGKSPTAPIVTADFPALMAAIVAHENAGYRYPETDIGRAITLA